MAPEYVITGHYSVKSDVYSFGIIVLEIISGQKNKFVRLDNEDRESLVHRVSNLWLGSFISFIVNPYLL